ncbi:MAG: hypothetical protein JSV91_04205 [Phycisphaerales bacterium]|nr:MAG: hypothetical protein JSV91_04205 [Phycisphaerales bacterium]
MKRTQLTFGIAAALCLAGGAFAQIETVDFTTVAAGASVEGLGTVHTDLNIQSPGNAVRIVAGGAAAYGAPNNPNCHDIAGYPPNGCIDAVYGGFSQTGSDGSKTHRYTFTFSPGMTVSDFSLRMLDYGDYNPSKADYHYARMYAVNASDGVVDEHILDYWSDGTGNPTDSAYGNLLCGAGDACDSQPGDPGNWTWSVAGEGIVRIELEFGEGLDPKIGFDSVAFTVDGPCGNSTTVDLCAGQNIPVGNITVENDDETLCVVYNTTGDWYITETHLSINTTGVEDFPQTKSGNPKVGQFEHKHTFDPPVQVDEFCFLFSDLGIEVGDTAYIAAHAVVVMIVDGVIVQEETAWGDGCEGEGFPGNNWATYFSHLIECASDECEPLEGFRTQTQGGWGTGCNGDNPGCYRDANFADCFPGGLVVGCQDGFTFTLTDSASVYNLLPTGGTPSALDADYVDFWCENNPDCDEPGGVLLGQVVALSLNVGFDLCDPDFGSSPTNLADLYILEGPCAGLTVGEVLDIANQILGGCYAGAITASEINECASKINEAFVDGDGANDCYLDN